MFQRKAKRTSQHNPKPLPPTDPWAYRMVVLTLGLTTVFCVSGAIWLQSCGKPTPELLTALGTGAIGALAGMLAPAPSQS